ncbi:MAG: TetR/AcrR family transcriptional regulator [Proteobacteria bacterium]|nr:TetR/AcrR family transcriptional regulator [Pseudomonadota bacterium]
MSRLFLNLLRLNMAGGRQLQFDKEKALEEAMFVFWKKGFLGASLSELTKAMSINKPSLYSAFGNKEDLFVSASEHYLAKHASPHVDYLNEDGLPLNERIKNYLLSVVTMLCSSSTPNGCFIAVAANELVGESLPEKATQIIVYAGNYAETYLAEFFTAEKAKGNLTADIEISQLTLLIITFMHGLSSVARSGKSQQQLQSVINIFVTRLCF